MSSVIEFSDLPSTDLVVDAMYRGGSRGTMGDDPMHQLLGVGLLGGFRYVGKIADRRLKLCALYSELTDSDWPDALHPETGQFVYFGDNKKPGHELHDTPRLGNQILSDVFEDLHTGKRDRIPPFFIFTKAGSGRDVVFRGLAVPGSEALSQTEDLTAVWKTTNGQRFQNYRAVFTILDVPRVERSWLTALHNGEPSVQSTPTPWSAWVTRGSYRTLLAPRTVSVRRPEEQLPKHPAKMRLLQRVVAFCDNHERGRFVFEKCAADLVQKMDQNVVSVDLTRPLRDGGRDALGKYRIGTDVSALFVDFALEAKCKLPQARNCSGVNETSRLISRLRYRQFGVFVTTSCVGLQAYREIQEDGHPVLIISGADIIEILYRHNVSDSKKLDAWLEAVTK